MLHPLLLIFSDIFVNPFYLRLLHHVFTPYSSTGSVWELLLVSSTPGSGNATLAMNCVCLTQRVAPDKETLWWLRGGRKDSSAMALTFLGEGTPKSNQHVQRLQEAAPLLDLASDGLVTHHGCRLLFKRWKEWTKEKDTLQKNLQ
jgi:hypothetical protein